MRQEKSLLLGTRHPHEQNIGSAFPNSIHNNSFFRAGEITMLNPNNPNSLERVFDPLLEYTCHPWLSAKKIKFPTMGPPEAEKASHELNPSHLLNPTAPEDPQPPNDRHPVGGDQIKLRQNPLDFLIPASLDDLQGVQ